MRSAQDEPCGLRNYAETRRAGADSPLGGRAV